MALPLKGPPRSCQNPPQPAIAAGSWWTPGRLFVRLEGIDCRSQINPDHMWTVATLDGRRVHIDVTWGDQYGRTDLRYFGMSEEQSYQYHPWSTQNLPK